MVKKTNQRYYVWYSSLGKIMIVIHQPKSNHERTIDSTLFISNISISTFLNRVAFCSLFFKYAFNITSITSNDGNTLRFLNINNINLDQPSTSTYILQLAISGWLLRSKSVLSWCVSQISLSTCQLILCWNSLVDRSVFWVFMYIFIYIYIYFFIIIIWLCIILNMIHYDTMCIFMW